MNTLKRISKRRITKHKGLVSKRESAAKVVKDKATYKKAMAEIDQLMAKGSKNVSRAELSRIRTLALAAQAYEKSVFAIPPPTTLAGIIEMKMYEMRLKQKGLAEMLNVSNAKLSLILNGKQKPDVAFLKAVHEELSIDANLLLKIAV